MQYIVVKKFTNVQVFLILVYMEITGNLRKMLTANGEVIQYALPLGDQKVNLNELIGHRVKMVYQGIIHCIRCGRETSKSFAQGYCYPCFTTAPETEDCVLRPELCRAHEGIARDMEYARTHCLIEHVVYLSLTSGIKVGVTRNTQVPTRWIDQGAIRAIEIARTPNRYTAGLAEVALKKHMDDKTNWRKMLTGPGPQGIDLSQEKRKMSDFVPEDLRQFLVLEDRETFLNYPVASYPEKVNSLNFDKDTEVSGTLEGIKGQYLFFSGNRVINIRKFGGYLVSFRAE
jgi:hypothetical protein